ncbi:phosphatidate cytidylyltransferase [Halorarum halobium]|uniref:phosphatidate cytidylyltransferase n=1 Tax=Halorarum halobium TaxID=3075121 RepID=UPI0028ACE5DE|nr:phosphatidate cytidylyltransferase [Halobaculum sp. XH14]
MLPSDSFRDHVSVYRAGITGAFLLVAAAIWWVVDGPFPPFLAVLIGGTATFMLASTVDAVRAHPLYDVLSAVFTVALFGSWYVLAGSDSTFLLALTGLALLGTGVEVYNYRNGTSYLRFELDEGTDSG